MFKLFYLIEEIVTKKWALVSSNLDERVKSYGYLKNQGQTVLRKKDRRQLPEVASERRKIFFLNESSQTKILI